MAPRRKPRRIGQVPKRKAGKAPAAKASSTREASGGSSRSGSSRSGSSCSGSSRSSEDVTSSGESASDEDDPRDYKHGGYHPVTPYQLYNARYRVLSKLGAGAFSTVWLCADEKGRAEDGPELVAMKVCKSKKSVTEQAIDEIALFERLQDGSTSSDRVVQMRGHFWHSGPNGRHKCMVFEVMGENLLTLVKHYDYDGLPVPMVQRIVRHTLEGLAYIHSRGVIHTDVKLENVLVVRHDLDLMMQEGRKAHRAFTEQKSIAGNLTKSQKKRLKKKQKNAKGTGESADEPTSASAAASAAGAGEDAEAEEADADKAAAEACGRPVPPVRQRARLESLRLEQVFAKLADFGNGCRTNRKVTDDIQTRQYRSPEVIIGAEWDESADVWSAACMFFELLTGDFLFDPRSSKDWSRDEDHLALMIELLGGHPPKQWALSGKYSKDFFLNSGKLKHIKKLKFWSLAEVLMEKYKMLEEKAEELADFLLPMLRWEPATRQPAAEALRHRWLQEPNGTTGKEPPPAPKGGGLAGAGDAGLGGAGGHSSSSAELSTSAPAEPSSVASSSAHPTPAEAALAYGPDLPAREGLPHSGAGWEEASTAAPPPWVASDEAAATIFALLPSVATWYHPLPSEIRSSTHTEEVLQ